MTSYIDPKYRIDIYLDTNILVDYIEGNYPALTYSLDYLAQTGYVTFRTSQYVLYEFGEVRKYNIYLSSLSLKPEHTDMEGKKLKSLIKRDNWKYNGTEYKDPVRTLIETQVLEELDDLEEKLSLETNLHLLHRELYQPSLLCVLKTPISKEDGLVLTSSILPKEDVRLDYSVILSGDKAYGTAFNENVHVISTINGLDNVHIEFLKITELEDPQSGRKVNLRDCKIDNAIIRDLWNHIILKLLCGKNALHFVGKTYKFGTNNKYVFFEREENSLPLQSDGNFNIIPKDLSISPLFSGDELGIQHYGTPITTPHQPKIEGDKKIRYSFLAIGSLKDHMELLSQEGNLIFYNED